MGLEGQGSSLRFDDRGFTMVVLLVAMAAMAIGMSAMLPTWRQQVTREKESELIFRGNQYARSLVLYARKNNNLLPPSVDVLVTGKYLRKKWKDPITNDDFGLTPAGMPAGTGGSGIPGQPVGTTPGRGPGPTGATPGAAGGGRAPGPAGSPAPSTPGRTGGGTPTTAPAGPQMIGTIQGVYSKSSATSIRVYQNQQRYIDWPFTMQTAQALMGQVARGMGGPPPSGPGGGDGRTGIPGRGNPPGPGGTPPRGGGTQPRGGMQPPRGGGIPQPAVPGRGGRGTF